MITREQIENIYKNNGCVKFSVTTYWKYTDIEALNDLVDDTVEDGHLFCDLSYEPVSLSGYDLTIEVTVGDMSEFLNPENH